MGLALLGGRMSRAEQDRTANCIVSYRFVSMDASSLDASFYRGHCVTIMSAPQSSKRQQGAQPISEGLLVSVISSHYMIPRLRGFAESTISLGRTNNTSY